VKVVLSKLLEITTWVAFDAVTVSVEELPCVIVAGVAAIVTVGIPTVALTVTLAFALAVPPGPVAVAV
jgi:copper homeostasis protein CutC